MCIRRVNMDEQELRQWAIIQAVVLKIGVGGAGACVRDVARDFVDFIKQNDDGAVADAARRLADKVKPDEGS